jgi:hypothetical protein
MKCALFWDVTPCWSCNNRRFGETYHLLQSDNSRRTMNNVSINLKPKNVVLSSPILVTLMTEVIRSSETSVLTMATRYSSCSLTCPTSGSLWPNRGLRLSTKEPIAIRLVAKLEATQ